MIRWASRLLLLVLLLSFVSPGALPAAQAASPQPAAGTRLVVFESFTKITWTYSQAASVVVNDQITADYANRPVVIIGYDDPWAIDNANSRRSRYKAADPTGPVTLPHLIADSGQQFSRGATKDQAYYNQKIHSMIDAELGREPQAALTARYARVGNHVEFTVQVTNQSPAALYSATNGAMVHAVVYESFTNATRPGALTLMNNFVRAVAYKSISKTLNVGDTGTYSLVTPDLPADVNWNNLHMLTMVDYRPGGGSGPYDMLQAAFAQPSEPTYTLNPTSLTFLVSSQNPADQSAPLQISSNSATLTWSITESSNWLSVSPASGNSGASTTVTISAAGLSPGSQSASLTIQLTDADGFSRTVSLPVTAYLGEIRKLNLPSIRR